MMSARLKRLFKRAIEHLFLLVKMFLDRRRYRGLDEFSFRWVRAPVPWQAISVTARMISSFTAESKELHRWPGAWDRAVCAAVNDDTLLKCRAEAAGYVLIRDEEIELLELGRQYLRRKRANEEAEMIERRLAGVRL